jgi:aromatic-amino-acid transaminase
MTRPCKAWSSAPTASRQERPRRHRAGLGGTGGLKIGADFLKQLNPNAKVLISDPSWENHRALFTNAGFTVEHLPVLRRRRARHQLRRHAGRAERRPAGTVVVLHACCHNPTGYDITPSSGTRCCGRQGAQAGALPRHGLPGLRRGHRRRRRRDRQFMAAGLDFFVSTSFSKSFSLYGERVGALSVVCEQQGRSRRVLSQLKIVIRTNYSNPPTHGAQVVATVLNTPALRAMWEEELAGMRVRIKQMRVALVDKLKAAGVKQDMSFITQQLGMFSYSGSPS